MDLKHLQTFLTLSEIKNFTKTAEHLHYAQSNVTTQIQQLEQELNVKLFERIGKSITLTSAGSDLIPYASKMLALSKDLARNFSEKSGGRITIGASESMCIYRLPAIIKAFQASHPDTELYLQVLDTVDFTSLLSNHTIDIAFTLDYPVNYPNIITEMQIEESICAFSTPDHPLTTKQNLSIYDFADHNLILTGKDCCYRKRFEKELSDAGITPQIVLQTGSIQVIKQTAISGLGICLLPMLTVQKELEARELVRLNYETNYNITSQLIYHKDKWLSPYLKELISLIKEISSI